MKAKPSPKGKRSAKAAHRAAELSDTELANVTGGSLRKVLSETLSNISKARAEISQTFARNARG